MDNIYYILLIPIYIVFISITTLGVYKYYRYCVNFKYFFHPKKVFIYDKTLSIPMIIRYKYNMVERKYVRELVCINILNNQEIVVKEIVCVG